MRCYISSQWPREALPRCKPWRARERIPSSFPISCRKAVHTTTRRLRSVAVPNRKLSSRVPDSTMAKKALDINSTYRMNSGYEIPVLGFGVYQTPASEACSLVEHAIQVGYRHVDSAVVYRNEQSSAAGLRCAGIPRSELFFTSKVPPRQMNHAGATACINETLRITGLDYIDLYLLHAPYGGKEGRLGAWKALAEAVEQGKVRSIGVSNFGVHHLNELEGFIKQVEALEGEGKGGILSVNQVELHPWLARKDIVEWCQRRGVLLEAYSPLVRGQRMDDPLLRSLMKKHNKTAAQILLRWSLQKEFIPLPKSVTPSRIEQNAAIFDFELDVKDMQRLYTEDYAPCTWDPTVSRD
ncbi:NADP-dependent oxidoreductase domain-containing protein [Lineolata rhizophorae]|uniref:NADP-dependent oxidoreductase domain-containing protein n=1 Tax=Lineolata rhizophorae TaxID=578093 RepID=A0A6A6P2B7_9PEZI|nr:NADP-dependent oxidoreductase domain-containing protein [Lineolata rhizophorae]